MTDNKMIACARAACFASLLMCAAGVTAEPGTAARITASVLWYEEKEAGTDSYPLRILVSAGFVRIDDDDDNGDFVLLDRATRNLYSVSREEQNILVIEYRPHELPLPADLRLGEVIDEDDSAPVVAGRQALLIGLTANDTTCYRVAVVAGLLEDAVAGLTEYAGVLGNRQRGSLQSVPAEIQTPCFLSRYVYAPARHLQHGLPILERDGAGYQRSLVNYSVDEQVNPGLFVLPEGYHRFQLDSDGL